MTSLITIDNVMSFIIGLSLGAIVPCVIGIKTLFKAIWFEARGIKRVYERLDKAEKEVRYMIKREKEYTWMEARQDLPYDAMGDYSGKCYAMQAEPVSTGKESADDWYRAEFGGEE